MAVKYKKKVLSQNNTIPNVLAIALEIQSKNFSNDSLVMLAAMLSHRLQQEKSRAAGLDAFLSATVTYATNTKASYEERIKELEADIALREQAAFIQGATEQKGSSARNSADARHAITRERRTEIVAYWQQHILPTLSNEEAARRLAQTFPFLAHKTLVSYVRDAKKELQSASIG